MNEMFEKAMRLKLRFNYKGQSTTEDLWDIPVKKEGDIYVSELNNIFCVLEETKQKRNKGLYVPKSKEDAIIDLKIAIIKYIFETKQQEQKDKENAALKAERKQKILTKIAGKQDAVLDEMSIEDLTKLVDGL